MSLQWFTWNFLHFLLAVILKHLVATSVRSRVVKYRIVSKVVPKLLSSEWVAVRKTNNSNSNKKQQNGNCREQMSARSPEGEDATLDRCFEERTRRRVVTGKAPRIGFKFAGCRPTPVKESATNGEAEAGAQGSSRGARIIVATRKLFRPLSNVPRASSVYDLSSIHF